MGRSKPKKGAQKRNKKSKTKDVRVSKPSLIATATAASGSSGASPLPKVDLSKKTLQTTLSQLGVDGDDVSAEGGRQYGTSGGSSFPGVSSVTLFAPQKETPLTPKRALVQVPTGVVPDRDQLRTALLKPMLEDGGELPNEIIFSIPKPKPSEERGVQDTLIDTVEDVLDVAFENGNYHRIGRRMTVDRGNDRLAVQFNSTLVEPGLPPAAAVAAAAAASSASSSAVGGAPPLKRKRFLDEDLPDDDEAADSDFAPSESDDDSDSSSRSDDSDSDGDGDASSPQTPSGGIKRPRTEPKPAAAAAAAAGPIEQRKFLQQFGDKKRPQGKEVVVQLEKVTIPLTGENILRPVKIEALVLPTTTTGRPSAPEPISMFRVSQSDASKKQKMGITRNTGAIDVQKGHLIALELGGPDVPENIVPQWANFQANGLWRNMETDILKLANESPQVHMTVEPQYRPGAQNFHGLAFPRGFEVTVSTSNKTGKEIETRRYSFDQHRDATDDKLAERQFAIIDDEDDI